MSYEREINKCYQDPLDIIWTETVRKMGMTLIRSNEVFASWDGKGTLTIGSPEDLDPDDSLAQMLFHEICHALIQGPEGWSQENWGLTNTDGRDLVREHACIRLQAALGAQYGLRDFLAVTTEWRAYQDNLPPDPLDESDDPALPLAQEAYHEALNGRWSSLLQEALTATQTIVETTASFASAESLFSSSEDQRQPSTHM